VGIGYLGSYLAVGLGLVLSYVFGGTNKALYFSLVALLFLLFSLPCFLLVRERGNPYPRPLNFKMVRESTRETLITLRSSRRYPGLLRFLIGRMFYTDSINTVIGFMTLFAANVALHCDPQLDKGLAEDKATWIMVPAITFAILGGFSGGWLADRMGPKRMLHWVLRLWVCVFILASLISLLGLPLWTMYGVAVLAGIALGGTWAADRPYMLRLTPPNRVGEFYGLYGMVGRFSAIIGPALWAGIFVLATKKFGLTELRAQGLCILSLLLMILLSQFILRPVSDEPRNWAELEKQ
jgi:UMF1 family MFS transporter